MLTRVARGTDLVLVGLVCLVWVWVRDGLSVARGKDLVLVGLVCLVWVWVRDGLGVARATCIVMFGNDLFVTYRIICWERPCSGGACVSCVGLGARWVWVQDSPSVHAM